MPVTPEGHRSLLRALARDAAMVGPALLVAERVDHGLSVVRTMARRRRIPVLQVQDPLRAASYAAARETPLVLLVAVSPSWAAGAVAGLRASTDAPIVVIGLMPSTDQLIELLDAGANLLIEGLVPERELASRISAFYSATRRETRADVRWLQGGGLQLDLFSRGCSVDGQPVQLSRIEHRLLAHLMQHFQQTLPPEEIVRHVWQWSYGDGLNTLRIHIGRLRRKLDDDPRAPRFVASLRGAGYQFVEPVAQLSSERDTGDSAAQTTLGARLDGLYEILGSKASDLTDLAVTATRAIVSSNHCDAASMFRYEVEAQRSLLVASAGTSTMWNTAMRRGHALSGRFAGSVAATQGNVVQIADIARAAKRFPASATLMSADHLRSCLIVPLLVDGAIWGDVGYAKRQPKAFTPQETDYLRSVTDLLALRIPRVAAAA
jgi:DNA-binding response OmpR family regulator